MLLSIFNKFGLVRHKAMRIIEILYYTYILKADILALVSEGNTLLSLYQPNLA